MAVDFIQDPRDPTAVSLRAGTQVVVDEISADQQWVYVKAAGGKRGEVPAHFIVGGLRGLKQRPPAVVQQAVAPAVVTAPPPEPQVRRRQPDAPHPPPEAVQSAEADPAYCKYLAEFLGTYLLVLTVGCNVIDGSPVWAATSIACVLMVSIYALGSVSGANFNPAVTLAVALSGGIEWLNALIYVVVQLLAGSLAGLTYWGLYGKTFALGPGEGFSWSGVMVAETLYTFMLCFVVLNVACAAKTNSGNQFFGLAIGFVIVAGGYAVGGISGGAFNPAVACGIDLTHSNFNARWCGAYVLFEFLGAIIAAALFRLIRAAEFDREISKTLSSLLSEFL